MMDTELRASASNENVTTNLEEDQGIQDEAEERRDEHLLNIFNRQPRISPDFHLRRDNLDCNSQGTHSVSSPIFREDQERTQFVLLDTPPRSSTSSLRFRLEVSSMSVW